MRVEKMVRRLVAGCSGIVHATRVAAVVKAVGGIIHGGRSSPASIGRNLAGPARPKHGIKCIDRLLGNPHLALERWHWFRVIAHQLLSGCERPVILIDWTQAIGDHQALVAAVPIGGRALPIYLEVHPLKKLGNAAVESHFLQLLSAILPPECRPIIVSDAGFKGPLFEAVQALGWHFLGRVRGTAKALPEDGPAISKEEFYAMATPTPNDLGTFELFVKQRIKSRLVLVRKRRRPGPKLPPPKNKEEREYRESALHPWLIATSITDGSAAYIVSLYAKRMQIEETFRDAKNHRFGWSLRDVRTACATRAVVLLLLISLAMVVVTLIGIGAEARDAHRAYQANTTRTRVLSFFVLACAIIQRDDEANLQPNAFDAALTSVAGRANA
jgi:hypothetical protein